MPVGEVGRNGRTNGPSGALLEWTTDYLKQHGSESPRLEPKFCWLTPAAASELNSNTSFVDPASEELRTRFRDLVRRRGEGMPVAYLVGHRDFFSLDFSRHVRRADPAA